MASVLDAAGALALLDRAAGLFEENRGALDALDAAIGDGDHGTSLAKSFAAAQGETADRFAADPPGGPGLVFETFGSRLLETSRGASGPLYATLFLSLGQSLGAEKTADVTSLAKAFRAAAEEVSRRGGARPGDATMLDALVPYSEELSRASESGESLEAALSDASRAATAGAEATADMLPARGRARVWAEKAVGHSDPGAQSCSLLARAIAEAVTSQ